MGFLQGTLRGRQAVATGLQGLSQLVHVYAGVVVGVVLVEGGVGGAVALHLFLNPQLLHAVCLRTVVSGMSVWVSLCNMSHHCCGT